MGDGGGGALDGVGMGQAVKYDDCGNPPPRTVPTVPYHCVMVPRVRYIGTGNCNCRWAGSKEVGKDRSRTAVPFGKGTKI